MAAASAFVLTGCTENDLSSDTSLAKESAPSAIQFSAKTRNAGVTRAIPSGGSVGDITTTVLKGADYGFGVVAYHTNTVNWAGASNEVIPNFMWNQQVTFSTDHWTYSPVKFWPNDFSTSNVDNQEPTGEDKQAWGSQDGGKVSFFAYAPYVPFATSSATYKHKTASQQASPATAGITALTANSVTAEPQVYYVLSNADVDNAVDLLWGIRGNSSGYGLANNTKDDPTANDYNVNLTKQSVGESVNFLFKHALSKLGGHTKNTDPAGLQTGLQIVLDVDNGSENGGVKPGTAISGGVKQANTLVTVEKIEIYDKKTASAAPVAPVIYTPAQNSDLVKEGWFNIATGKWDLTTGEGSVQTGATYSSVVDKNSTGDFAMNAQIKEDAAGLTYDKGASKWKTTAVTDGISGVTTDVQDVYTNDSDVPSLVLIPSNTDQTLVVRIKYIVRTYDENISTSAASESGTWTKVTQTITNEVKIPAGALASNKYYKLLIHLGLTSVKFTASVVDWEEAAGSSTGGTSNTDTNYDKDVYLPSNTLQTESYASTETVNTATLAAGTSKTYSVPASGNFTLTVTGLKDSETPTVVKTGAATDASATEAASNSSTVTVTLPDNNSEVETQTTTLTISGNKSDSTPFSMTVTLVQVQKVATP